MDKYVKKIKQLILNNSDKRVLVLGAVDSGIEEVYKELKIGEWYDKVFDDMIGEKFGYIDERYISLEEKQKIRNGIVVKKGIPLFSHKLVDSDVVIFLYVNPIILRLKSLIEGYTIVDRQNSLLKELRDSLVDYVLVNVGPNDLSLLKIKRNVYIYDNVNDYYLTDRKNLEDDEIFLRFPYIKRVEDITELKRKQGFMLIVNEEYLNISDLIEMDRKYRRLFSQFNYVYVVTDDRNKIEMFHMKFTNVYFVDKSYFDDEVLLKIYYDYLLKNNDIKYSKKKLERLEGFNAYFKNKDLISTNELAKKFNMSSRNVERYMSDYNQIYNSIGYDYSENRWYIIH